MLPVLAAAAEPLLRKERAARPERMKHVDVPPRSGIQRLWSCAILQHLAPRSDVHRGATVSGLTIHR